jgi:hypothetical protein
MAVVLNFVLLGSVLLPYSDGDSDWHSKTGIAQRYYVDGFQILTPARAGRRGVSSTPLCPSTTFCTA